MKPTFIAEDGAAAVYFALLAPVLIGFAALGGEAGLWLIGQRKLQHITDTAAYSAAIRALSTQDLAVIKAAAKNRADSSGLLSGDSLNIFFPPNSGPFKGKQGHAEVIAERHVPRYLTALFYGHDDPVVLTSRSVAGMVPGSGEPVCMLALSATASPAFAVGGAGDVNVVGCAFASNSSAADSFAMIGGRVTVTGSCLYSVGGVKETDGLTLTDCEEPQPLQRPAADPLSSLPMPSSTDVAGLIRRPSGTVSESLTASEYLVEYPDLPVALFDGGLRFDSETMINPGLYIVDGGTLDITAGARLVGTGVTFYLMNGAQLKVNGGAELDVSAYDADNPGIRTDPFAGLLFFSDRVGTSVSHSFSGNSGSDISGVVYFPTDNLTFTGDSGSSYPCLEIIASRLTVGGSGTVTIGCEPDRPASLPRAETAQEIALLE